MNAHALLKRFDIVADQPANIPSLRRLVVDLAVRGKLLAAEALDMDVQEMLKRISLKAVELASKGVIKKLKPISKISDDEVPVAYLAHCTFARLGSIANLEKGLTGIQSSTPGEFPLVVTSAIRGTCDHFDFDGAAAIIPLVSSTGHGNASINRLHYQEGKFALGTILCAVFPFDEQLISARFLYEYLTAFKEELLVSKMIGTANVTLTLGKIAEVPVPILAPAVQRRVDELMTLCDQLEAAQQERERRRDRLASASLQRLNQPALDATPETQGEHALFHLYHLPRITTKPEHIKAIRQTILNLAVSGKLLKQDANDEPATKLLKRIQAEKARLAKLGRIKTEKAAEPIDQVVGTIPSGWALCRWNSIAMKIGDIDHKMPDTVAEGVPYVSPRDFYPNNVIDFEGAKRISRADYLRLAVKIKPDLDDLIYPRYGTIGENRLVAEQREFLASYSCAVVKTLTGFIDPKYQFIFSISGYCKDQAKAAENKTTQANVGIASIQQYIVPLPPLAEQHRIVAKVDSLMALCDQLEAQLTTTQTDSRRLLEAVLEAALAPV